MAMPFLRAFTDHMKDFVNQQAHLGWDFPQVVPHHLKQEVMDLHHLTTTWVGRPFLEKIPLRKLHSDSSQNQWAGVDIINGTVVQEFWS